MRSCAALTIAGTLIGGVSAGMICWFDWGVTDSIPGALTPLRCLGWLPGSACPHYDAEKARRPTFRRLVGSRTLPSGFAADDGVALHFVDDALHDVVSARPRARAWWVDAVKRPSARDTDRPAANPLIGRQRHRPCLRGLGREGRRPSGGPNAMRSEEQRRARARHLLHEIEARDVIARVEAVER